jgi:hypothetical protein
MLDRYHLVAKTDLDIARRLLDDDLLVGIR